MLPPLRHLLVTVQACSSIPAHRSHYNFNPAWAVSGWKRTWGRCNHISRRWLAHNALKCLDQEVQQWASCGAGKLITSWSTKPGGVSNGFTSSRNLLAKKLQKSDQVRPFTLECNMTTRLVSWHVLPLVMYNFEYPATLWRYSNPLMLWLLRPRGEETQWYQRRDSSIKPQTCVGVTSGKKSLYYSMEPR